MAFRSLLVACLIAIVTVVSCSAHVNGTARTECKVQQGLNSDDAIEIKRAFAECGQGGRIIFANTTYNVASVMNTTGLKDVDIELHGTLLVNISSTRKSTAQTNPASGPRTLTIGSTIRYQSGIRTSLALGSLGERTFTGMDSTTAHLMAMVRSGMTCRSFRSALELLQMLIVRCSVNGESNYPNRPHAITLFLKDSVVEGLRFVQSQMW